MSSKISQLHDLVDGIQQVLVVVPERKRRKESFLVADQVGIAQLCHVKGLADQDWRVYFAYWANAQYENYVYLSQVEIAEFMGIERQRVNASVKKLLKAKLMFRHEVNGRLKGYRISAVVFWKGRPNRTFQDVYEEHSSQLELAIAN